MILERLANRHVGESVLLRAVDDLPHRRDRIVCSEALAASRTIRDCRDGQGDPPEDEGARHEEPRREHLAQEQDAAGDRWKVIPILEDLKKKGHQVAYVGDDVIDLPVMRRCGLAYERDVVVEDMGQTFDAVLWSLDRGTWLADLEDLASLDPPCVMVQDWDAAGRGVPVEVIAEGFSRVPAFRSVIVVFPFDSLKVMVNSK